MRCPADRSREAAVFAVASLFLCRGRGRAAGRPPPEAAGKRAEPASAARSAAGPAARVRPLQGVKKRKAAQATFPGRMHRFMLFGFLLQGGKGLGDGFVVGLHAVFVYLGAAAGAVGKAARPADAPAGTGHALDEIGV